MTTPTNGLPRLNEAAPDFHAHTTHGDRNLADYQGKWLVLFSHPADFTPVCTTEFIAFARAHDRFAALNCELLGLSIDSLFAHLAWVRNIEDKFGVAIPFTSVRSPESNGVCKAFVNTFKRDYAAVNSRPDAISVLQRFGEWFDDYNTIHPHSGLRFQSPREFIQQQSIHQAKCPV